MSNELGTYRITLKMLEAGAAALEQCRRLGVHTSKTTCQAVFTAMLGAADVHPGSDLRKTFAWSPHDIKRDAHGRRLPANPLTRDMFDENGVRTLVERDGSVHRQLIGNFWYLREAWEAEKIARGITKA